MSRNSRQLRMFRILERKTLAVSLSQVPQHPRRRSVKTVGPMRPGPLPVGWADGDSMTSRAVLRAGTCTKTQKTAGQKAQLLTDLLTRPIETGETARDTSNAHRSLRLVNKTRRNVGDKEDARRSAHNPATHSCGGQRRYRFCAVFLTATVTATPATVSALAQP
jgi:hypothetical protein